MKKSNNKFRIGENSFQELNKHELKGISGGGSLKRFSKWVGRLASNFIPCKGDTGIGYHNYEDYVNPNDPLM